MKKITQHILSICALALLSTSCYNDNKEEIYQNITNTCDTVDISYSSVIKPIMTANCAISGCHVGTTPAASLDLNTYQGVKKSVDNGAITNRINGRGALMPQGGPPLPSCQVTQIEAWVNAGAPNN